MTRSPLILAAAALGLALSAPLALAQQAPPMMKDLMTQDHAVRTSKLVGMAVVNDAGEKVGTVIDILVRDSAAEPVAILSVGDYVGGGSKLVAVPLGKVNFAGAQPMMKGATKAMISAMPSYAGMFGSG